MDTNPVETDRSTTEPGHIDAMQALTRSPRGAPRGVDTLHDLLDRIAADGWESPTATALLDYVRNTIVRPLVVELGLRGRAATEAEGSAWEEVWIVLAGDGLRQAGSPWGVLWLTARRAVLSESISALYQTSPRRAWELAKGDDADAFAPVRALPDLDHTDLPTTGLDGCSDRPRPGVTTAIECLVKVGWDAVMAREIVLDILADEPNTRSTRWTVRPDGWAAYGWRTMAERLHLPPWQARRLIVVLRGTPLHPGLLPRLIKDGGSTVLDPTWWSALATTLDRARRSPRVPAASIRDEGPPPRRAERDAS